MTCRHPQLWLSERLFALGDSEGSSPPPMHSHGRPTRMLRPVSQMRRLRHRLDPWSPTPRQPGEGTPVFTTESPLFFPLTRRICNGDVCKFLSQGRPEIPPMNEPGIPAWGSRSWGLCASRGAGKFTAMNMGLPVGSPCCPPCCWALPGPAVPSSQCPARPATVVLAQWWARPGSFSASLSVA